MLPCNFTNRDIKVNGIAIRAVHQYPEFDSPVGKFVLIELSDAGPFSRLNLPFINYYILPRLIKIKM